MSDPITTVVTVISEHPQAVAAVASIYGVAKPFLEKILGPSADELGEIGRDYIKGRRAKNAERTLGSADKMLTEAGREPQEVPLAVVVPLLEAASLQEEPTLADLWAALLANAADPAQQTVVHPGFIMTLQQLTADDALVLAFVYQTIPYEQVTEPMLKEVDFDAELGLQQVIDHFDWPGNRTGLSIENLRRLRLIDIFTSPAEYDEMSNTVQVTGPYITPQEFGRAFLAAVTPPTP